MRYAGIIKNDIAAAPGVCVTFFTQGCPHRCKGCHNPETWDFDGGKEFSSEVIDELIKALKANGVKRKFCVMGGEPLCEENLELTNMVISQIKEWLPRTEVYVWTGYIYEDLLNKNNPLIENILRQTNVLIDGPYIQRERDITCEMRGSRNQRIIQLTKTKKNDII